MQTTRGTGSTSPPQRRRIDGADVIVFGWDEGLPGYGGSLYSVRSDGTGLALLSPGVGDGRPLGCYGSPRADDQPSDYRLAFDASPAISPDGATLAYSTARQSTLPEEFDLVAVELESGELRRLTPVREAGRSGLQRRHQDEPAWSPDGTRIAFLERGTLHIMAADGSDARRIAPGIVSAPEPSAWSPDGTLIAFRGRLSSKDPWSLYVVAADGSNLGLAVDGKPATDADILPSHPMMGVGPPVWSPYGQHIALLRTVVRSESPLALKVDAQVLDTATGAIRTVLKNAVAPMVWSSDGTELLFYAEEQPPRSGRAIYAVAVDEDSVVRRFAGLSPNKIIGMSWSPDGTRLAMLARPFSYVVNARYSPHDVLLWSVAADGSDARWLVRVDSGGQLRGWDGAGVAAGEAVR